MISAVGCPFVGSGFARVLYRRQTALFRTYLSPDMPRPEARRSVAVVRCEPCINPHDFGDMLKYLPAGWTQLQ